MKMNSIESFMVKHRLRGKHLEKKELPAFLKMQALEKKKIILEVGCGAGFGLDALFKTLHPAKLYGIDIDEKMIALAKERCKDRPNIIFQNTSATALSFQENMFDAVFSFAILHHIEDWQTACKEIYRVMKPGATFYFEEFSRPALHNPLFKLLFDHPQENRFIAEEFVGELIKIGFKDISYHNILDDWWFRGIAKK